MFIGNLQNDVLGAQTTLQRLRNWSEPKMQPTLSWASAFICSWAQYLLSANLGFPIKLRTRL